MTSRAPVTDMADRWIEMTERALRLASLWRWTGDFERAVRVADAEDTLIKLGVLQNWPIVGVMCD